MPSKRKATSGDASSIPTKRVKFGDDVTTPASLPVGPGGPMEIVFSFDTTGSMSSCLFQVRKNLSDMISRLQKDIPGLRMAVFAHGDYCDAKTSYVTKYVDFTNDVTKLVDFVNNVKSTGGGDADECYELVLYEVRTKLSWSPGTQRSLVMIGDANPHEPGYPQNKMKLDWRKEIDSLAAEGVSIYGVNCGNSCCEDFYQMLAKKTHGRYLELKDWNNIFDMMMAICYREHGAEFFKAYEHEVRTRGPVVSHEMDAMLKTLRRADDDRSDGDDGTTTVVTSSTPPVTTTALVPRKVRTRKPTAPKAMRRITKSKTRSFPKKRIAKSGLIRKRLRERCGRYPFQPLYWSDWQRLMSPTKPKRMLKNWIPLRSKVTGFRRIGLFKDDTDSPAFYEIGVKAPGARKVTVVYYRLANGFIGACHLDTYLLKHSHVCSQMDDVIKNGCDVYIRRARLPDGVEIDGQHFADSTAVRSYIRKNYDYAWNKAAPRRKNHRVVVKRGVRISSDKY